MSRSTSAPRAVARAVARATGAGGEWRRLRAEVVEARGEARAARREALHARRQLEELLVEVRGLRDDAARREEASRAQLGAAVAAVRGDAGAHHEDLLARLGAVDARVGTRLATHQVAPALWRGVRAGEVGTWSLLALRDLLPGATRLPPPGGAAGWAATPETVLLLVREVLARREHPVVVELGSGTSTAWVAAALRERGGGRVVSVEHDEHYADGTRRALRAAGLDDLSEVLVGALAPLPDGTGPAGHTTAWYPEDVVRRLPPLVDLLFVDGPPGGTGPAARRPALPALAGLLAPGAAVVLDDTDRPEEREVVARWLEDVPGLRVEATTDRATLLRVPDDHGGPRPDAPGPAAGG
ncbi:class I SAM-dependent methyltransferase [Pseudokineococcus lusitanus]|uniref:Methyltransferase family protein n=1 Tax=Pseudokineococcus lusitanus TaxID=763993 RepID=A0A3N1G8Y5_9ACTN|nr:class I SAM-dependent methyltransferase [Pseudokineococcus lusitanus]ROP26705.1 methyltransferase family protein [Pseudokineococcus lusitanus]